MNVSALWQRHSQLRDIMQKAYWPKVFVQDFQSPALPIIMSNLLLIQNQFFNSIPTEIRNPCRDLRLVKKACYHTCQRSFLLPHSGPSAISSNKNISGKAVH